MALDPAKQLKNLLDNGRTARDLVLKGAGLRGVQLSRLRADGLNLEDADLRESSLTQVNFRGCVLRDARLDAADLTDAILRICELDQARATGAKFLRTRLENSTARGARFDGADFTRAVLTDTDFSRGSFRGANLQCVSASGADFRGADLSGACLKDAVLADSDLRGADLTGADVEGADFQRADLRGVVGNNPGPPRDEGQAGLPTELQALSETMTPIVLEVLRTGGRRGGVDPKTLERLMEEAAPHHAPSPHNAPNPETLQAVLRVLNELGDNSVGTLLAALQQPQGKEPPPEVQSMILRLREAFSLDETATTEDVLSRLVQGMGRPPQSS